MPTICFQQTNVLGKCLKFPPLGPAHRWSHRDIQRNSCEASTTTDNSNVVEGKPRDTWCHVEGFLGTWMSLVNQRHVDDEEVYIWNDVVQKHVVVTMVQRTQLVLDGTRCRDFQCQYHCCSASSCCIYICCYMRIIGSWSFHWSYKVWFRRYSLVHWM